MSNLLKVNNAQLIPIVILLLDEAFSLDTAITHLSYMGNLIQVDFKLLAHAERLDFEDDIESVLRGVKDHTPLSWTLKLHKPNRDGSIIGHLEVIINNNTYNVIE